jgi:hypothetical protein
VGDFNSHVGGNFSSSLGIPNNNGPIGGNGFKLLFWLKKWNKLIVNAQKCTQGLYTRRRGQSQSVLDLMIIDDFLLPLVKGLIIDDMGECREIKTDHFSSVALIDLNYKKLSWAKPNCKVWSVPKTDKNLFKLTLHDCLLTFPECSESYMQRDSVDGIASAIEQSILSSLKVSSQEVNSCPKKKAQPPDVTNLDKVIREINNDIYWLSKKTMSMEISSKITELEHKLRSTIETKFQMKYTLLSETSQKTYQIIKKKGTNSKRFWSEVKPCDTTEINSFRKEDGSHTITPEQTMERVHEYFNKLFSKTEHLKESSEGLNPKKRSKLGHSHSLVKQISQKTVMGCLAKLKKDKASGPDRIKN